MESWKALNAWILSRFEIGRGVVILNFGKISWESNTDIKNVVMRRPTFLISESFSKTHGLPFKRKLKALSLAPMEDINFTKLAIKYSNSMTKDVVFCAVRDIIARLGIVIGAGKMVNIQMSIGRLIAKDRVVTMEFDPNCFPKTVKVPASMVAELEQRNVDNEKVTLNQEEQGSVDKAKVVIRIPTMGTVDVDEERSTHERLDEERSTDERLNEERSTHKRLNEEKSTHEKLEENREESNVGSEVILPKSDQDTVLEDAYRRHLEEVDREIHRDQMDVAQVWDKHRQDCLSVAHEKRNFRTKAEQAQQLIRCQIQDRELARKKNAALTNATLGPCNILPGSPRYPEPVDDTFGSDRRISHLRRQQSELQRQLDMQVETKKNRLQEEQEIKLQAELQQLSLIKVEAAIEQERQLKELREKRKKLTAVWDRDNHLKTMVKMRRKQLVRKNQKPKVQVNISNSLWEIPVPKTARPSTVGYDIRNP